MSESFTQNPLSEDEKAKIRRNLEEVFSRIHRAATRAARSPDSITLVAVTKQRTAETIAYLYELGIRHFGENRVQEALPKITTLCLDATWHMIGTVQTRKVKEIVPHFHTIDSVDRLELAAEIEKRCAAVNKVLPVLLEVNVSGEPTKHGFRPDLVENALENMQKYTHLRVEGLMTMAPFGAPPEALHRIFGALRRLAEIYRLPRISMGMSDDFDIAVEEGATEVRLGRILYT